MSEAPAAAAPDNDLAALARGGRINFMGFLLRLAARLPFLFIAGRMYGAEALGRFAYAVLVVEFVAQLATLGLKRGLAQQLSKTDKPHVCVVWDALLVGALGSLLAMALLFVFPQAMFPNSEIYGLEWLLPISVLALASFCQENSASPPQLLRRAMKATVSIIISVITRPGITPARNSDPIDTLAIMP